jgi:hypothetical protein
MTYTWRFEVEGISEELEFEAEGDYAVRERATIPTTSSAGGWPRRSDGR